MVGVANPKSIISLMTILPQFVDHHLGHPTFQMAIIGLAGGIAQVLIETLWVGVLDRYASGFSVAPAVSAASGLVAASP